MSSEARRRLVCRCMGVASPCIYDAIRAQGLTSVAAVTKAVRAGGGCGVCHPEIEEILADASGEPIDSALALENHLVCRLETTARIEGSAASLLAPRLAALGARIEAIRVDGLRVDVRIAGSRDANVLRVVGETLRKYVCEDLEVEVELE